MTNAAAAPSQHPPPAPAGAHEDRAPKSATLPRVAARTALGYALVAGAWIVLSDRALALLSPAPATIHALQTYKGWAFVIVTALLLYTTLRAQLQRSACEAALREAAETALQRDLEERTRTEARLRAALADNQTLLREVHHRTKNSLQMLCSLLELQADAIDSLEGKEALELSTRRIYAIARLYEQLYRSMSGGHVILCEYLRGLAQSFQATYGRDGITVELPPMRGVCIDVDRAIPCGLIVNELLTNAVKHAFVPTRRGTVGLGVEQADGMIELRVWDTGRGLPPGLDFARSDSLGLRLVRILAQRLQATMAVENGEGATFTLTFPLAADAPVEPQ